MTVRTSESLTKLAPALVKAQMAMKAALKESNNPAFKSKYADLESTREACYQAFFANGFAVVQMPGFDGSSGQPVALLTTRLQHESGEWIESEAGSPLVKHDAQGVGSALTYLRRYSLQGFAFLAPEDDDGNAASMTGAQSRPALVSDEAKNAATTRPFPPTIRKPNPEAGGFTVPFGKQKGAHSSTLDDAALSSLRTWCLETDAAKFAKLIDQCDDEMEARRVAANEGT